MFSHNICRILNPNFVIWKCDSEPIPMLSKTLFAVTSLKTNKIMQD